MTSAWEGERVFCCVESEGLAADRHVWRGRLLVSGSYIVTNTRPLFNKISFPIHSVGSPINFTQQSPSKAGNLKCRRNRERGLGTNERLFQKECKKTPG